MSDEVGLRELERELLELISMAGEPTTVLDEEMLESSPGRSELEATLRGLLSLDPPFRGRVGWRAAVGASSRGLAAVVGPVEAVVVRVGSAEAVAVGRSAGVSAGWGQGFCVGSRRGGG